MIEETPWRVDVLVDDVTAGERTRAWTRLRTPDGTTFVGVGEADHGPMGTEDVAAVSHALSDLTRKFSPATPSRDRHSTLRHGLAELAGYLGGGLMFGGAALLVATSWADLTRPGRIALLTAVTVGFVSAGLLVSGRPLPRRSMTGGKSRLAAVLLGLGAGTSALTAGSIAVTDKGFWATVAGFVVATLGYLVVRSAIGILVSAVFSGMAVGMFVGEVLDAGSVALGVALVVVGLTWNVLDASGSLTPPGPGFAVGAAVALVGAQQPLGEPGGAAWAYGLTFVVALVWLTGNLWHRSPVLLVAGIVGLTIAIPQAIWDWTDGAVGGALIALIAGAVLLIASAFGLRIGGPRWQRNRQNPAASRAHHRIIPGGRR